MEHRWMSTGLVLVMACGPQVSNEPGRSGGETSGTSTGSAGTGSSTGGVGTTTGADGSSDTGTVGEHPNTCSEYADEALSAASQTVIEFRNSTEASLLLETNCGFDYLEVTNDAGWRWPGDFCSDTCEQQFRFGCTLCDGCATDSYEVVGPGGVLTVEWAGDLYDRASPPQACAGENGLCGSSCEVQRDALPAGEVRVRIVATRQDACEAAAREPEWCACPEGMTCDNNVYGGPFSATAEFLATGAPGETIVVEALE